MSLCVGWNTIDMIFCPDTTSFGDREGNKRAVSTGGREVNHIIRLRVMRAVGFRMLMLLLRRETREYCGGVLEGFRRYSK